MVLLRWSGLVLSVALGATGCSLIYDADDLIATRPVDAGLDAPVDARLNDANITALELTAVAPGAVYEGAGAGGSRPVLVTIAGSDIEASLATVSVAFEGEQPDPTATVVAAAVEPAMGHIVVALAVPVLPAVGDGQTATLNLTVTQGETSASIPLTVTGLDELETTAAVTIASGDLRARYSRIAINHPIHLTGTAPAQLRAVSDIDLAALVDADASGFTAGPGGCNGARSAPASGSGCGGGGGGGGTGALGAGGGGGGFGEPGNAGVPAGGLGTGGSAGGVTGDPLLSVLVYSGTEAGNRGNGGGTGGGALGGSAGTGGGGGGTIELAAGGALRVADGGALRAAGAAGAGGGGGGSGGAILVRSAGGLTAPDAAWVTTPAGAGNGNGGDGGFGRARVDTPSGPVAAMFDATASARGPAWAAGLPVLSRESMVTLGIVGTRNASHRLLRNGASAGEVLLTGDGTKDIAVPLADGVNELCLVVDPGASGIDDENKNCVTIAYVPE